MSESLTVALLFWATGANPSRLLFCSEQPEWFAHGLSLKKSNRVKSDYSDLLFGKGETYEKYIQFFYNFFEWMLVFENDPSASLMVALLSWATWTNRSGSLFNLSDIERKYKFPTLHSALIIFCILQAQEFRGKMVHIFKILLVDISITVADIISDFFMCQSERITFDICRT